MSKAKQPRKSPSKTRPRPRKGQNPRKQVVRTIEGDEGQAKTTAATEPAGAMSGLDAAAKVLKEAGEPLTCGQMVERMIARGYWTTEGKTPAATIYSAILREMRTKGDACRFSKVERGKFTLTA